MIPNGVFIGLRYLFLALVYIFLILVVRAIYREVKEPEVSRKARRRRRRERPELVVLAADRKQGARHRLVHQMIIGRSEASDIIIDDTYASQKHARVYRDNSMFFVEDLGSTNGTYVNGRKLSYPMELRPGDRIKIGKTLFEFRR